MPWGTVNQINQQNLHPKFQTKNFNTADMHCAFALQGQERPLRLWLYQLTICQLHRKFPDTTSGIKVQKTVYMPTD